MGSKATTYLAIFLLLNLIFFTLVSACGECPKPKPKPKPKCPPKTTKPNPKPKTPKPDPHPTPKATCPRDARQFERCANLLGLGIFSRSPLLQPCCSLFDGLADLEAALCLCTAVNLNVFNNIINLRVPVDISLILNKCGRKCPNKFQCSKN